MPWARRNRHLRKGGSSYHAVMDQFPMLKRYQPWQGARVTSMPDTAAQLLANVDHLHTSGVNQFIVGIATGIEWPDAALAAFGDQLLALGEYAAKQQRRRRPFRMTLYERSSLTKSYRGIWGCGAGRGRTCISVDGDLYGCGKILGVDDARKTNRLGDICRGITNLEARADLLDRTAARRPKCAQCEYRDECAGGCPATNFEATGSTLEPDPLECRLIPLYVRVRRKLAEAGVTAREGKDQGK